MIDEMAESGLIDLTGFDLTELQAEVDESSLAEVLRRIVASGEEGLGQHGFQSII